MWRNEGMWIWIAVGILAAAIFFALMGSNLRADL
jgi:hypothetical protein